jgi:DNA invertase Pin-like site-specific DNA recombinase
MSMTLPLAGYTRVSRVGDRQETLRPELQADRIRSYAETHGVEVELLPPELDVSGGKASRPILDEVRRGVLDEGRYGGVIVAQLDRLSRMGLADALKIINEFESAGHRVVSVAENFDASTPEGKFSRNTILGVGNLQLDRYKDGFRASKRAAVAEGIWPFPVVPIGYTVTRQKDGGDGKLKIDPATAPTVCRAFEARVDGHSWAEVGAIVDRSPSGAAAVVKNRVYLGEINLHFTGGTAELNQSAHPALVARDLWEAAQIDHPRQPHSGTGEGALLAGIARCAGCSGSLTLDGGYYRCRAYARAGGECAEPAIVSQAKLDEYLTGLVVPFIESLEYSAVDRGKELAGALEELAGAEAELAAYQQVTRVTSVGPDAFAAGMKSRVDAVDRARRTVGETRRVSGESPESGTLGSRWASLSVKQRNHVLRGALGAAFVRRGRWFRPDRVKILARGFEPADLPRHRGRTRAISRPFDWVDDAPGEVRAVDAKDVTEPSGSASP